MMLEKLVGLLIAVFYRLAGMIVTTHRYLGMRMGRQTLVRHRRCMNRCDEQREQHSHYDERTMHH